jgi:hypothetical protein
MAHLQSARLLLMCEKKRNSLPEAWSAAGMALARVVLCHMSLFLDSEAAGHPTHAAVARGLLCIKEWAALQPAGHVAAAGLQDNSLVRAPCYIKHTVAAQ